MAGLQTSRVRPKTHLFSTPLLAWILINRMPKRNDPFTVLVEQDEEGYFVATVPELRGCHTQAKSLDVLMRRVTEAITLCLAEG